MSRILVRNWSLSSSLFNLLVALLLVVLYNRALWDLLLGLGEAKTWFIAPFFVLLVLVFFLLLNLITVKYLHKSLVITLILSASLASYFVNSFGVMFDKTMIQNVLESDLSEVLDLMSLAMLKSFVLSGLLPAGALLFINIRYQPVLKEIRLRLLLMLISVIVIAANLVVFYKDFSSVFKNHSQIRNLVIPSSYLYYSAKLLSGAYEQESLAFLEIAKDAKLGESWDSVSRNKKTVLVVVVGETARAQSFSLNGYERETNSQLAELDVISYIDVTACGTSTAVSLPCMFSVQERDNFDKQTALNTENLLDTLKRVGFDVLWRENNSGCKGVCTRVDNQHVSLFSSDDFCENGVCFDEVLLNRLDDYLSQGSANKVIVLHQKGSHGPAYYKRYPSQFEKFTPVCKTADLNSCTQQSIQNSYDNSIVYTDFFLAKVVNYLKQRSGQYSSAMLYLSDHGESLGENNIYLHGLPFYMAPDTQKKIPFIAWLSEGFKQQFKINTQCLKKRAGEPLTHGNFFHSVLGLLGVQTAVYESDMDIFHRCRINK